MKMDLILKKILTNSLEFVKINIIGNLLFSKENRIPAILVFNAVIFSLLFTFDYRRKENFGARKAIGNIIFKKNSVQRKFDNRIIWSTLDLNSPISNKDSIKTEALADAIIRLADGTEIHIDENTMIFLDYSGFNPVINFKEGSIKVKKSADKSFFSSNIVIQSGEQKVEIGKSDVNLKKTKEDLDVFVEKRKATVTAGNNSQKIDEGMAANLNQGEIKSKKVFLSLNYPPDKIRIIESGETADVDFSWSGSEKGDLFLEISRNSTFSSIFMRPRALGDKLKLSIPEGTYYWRISSKVSGKDEHSETRKLIVVTDSAIKVFSPRNKENFIYRENLPSIDFHWNKRYLSSGYSLSISRSPDFKEKTESHETISSSMTISNLGEGTYYWKVVSKSELSDIPVRNSSVFQFVVLKNKQVSPVILQKPENESKFALRPESIIFEWEALDSKEFQIQISQLPDFKNLVFDSKISQSTLHYKNALNEGVYYWRVKNLEKGGDFSKVFRFTIPETQKRDSSKAVSNQPDEQIDSATTLEQIKPSDYGLFLIRPANKKAFEFMSSKEILLEWKTSESKDTQLQISEYSNFSNNIIDIITKENSFKFNKFQSGKVYYWRVRIDGKREYTKPFSFTIKDNDSSNKTKKIEITPQNSSEQVQQKVKQDEGPQVKPRRPTKETEEEREKRRKIELEKFNEYLKL